MSLVSRKSTSILTPFPPLRLRVDMAFDLLSRFRKPVPVRDSRGHHHYIPRPPPMVARVHAKRPPLAPPVRPQFRRVHHRDQHQPPLAMIPRGPAPARKGPVVRAPAPSRKVPIVRTPAPARKGPVMRAPHRPPPPQRGASSKLMSCLHIHFHPQKRDLAFPPPRSWKHGSTQQVPPFPPPRGTIKAPSRHVHWAPAQAPLPPQCYPYPTHASSRTTTTSTRTHLSSPPIPRYQPPAQLPPPNRDLVRVPHRRR